MAIENFDEVKQYFETNKDKDDVKAFVNGLNPVSVDRIKSLEDENKDIKSWLDSEKDKHSSKSLETWKTNNLQKLIDEKIKELYPEADPKDTKLAELQAQIQKMQKETTRKELTNKALKIATEKKLPVELVDYFIGEDEETTTKNIEALEKVFSVTVDKLVEERLKGGYTPPAGDKTTGSLTMEDLKGMSTEEINKIWDKIKK